VKMRDVTVAKSPGPTNPRWGRSAGQGLAPMKLHFQHVSCYVGKKRIRGENVGALVRSRAGALLEFCKFR
jgi:hypothetical protein